MVWVCFEKDESKIIKKIVKKKRKGREQGESLMMMMIV
jgi:hypothetical protein